VTDPGIVQSLFSFKPASPGVTVSPMVGITPATVTVTVDPSAFSALHGTQAVDLGLSSPDAINVIDPVSVLVNHPDPNQRGTILEVPGTLVDILADPVRDRYYVLRQDNNTLLVFDGTNNTQLKTLRTNNVPTSMAISFDHQYIYIAHDASQTLAIYNLDDFSRQPDVPTGAGNGNVFRSLAVANNLIIATSRDYKGDGHIL
jgi:DNA-binding beta-propeller fold protein YncE